MPVWALVGAAYAAVLAMATFSLPSRRRLVTLSATIAYALLGLAAGTLPQNLWVSLTAPAALLLGGYWLSGLFFRDPQPWLERWLRRSDDGLFDALALDDLLLSAPAWVLEALEAAYSLVYVVITAGAIVAATAGVQALDDFWTIVLTAELACYVWLPWLRSRPPRAVGEPGAMARRRPRLRRLNEGVLDGASVQANTLPSGHVAGAVAAALGVWPVSAPLGATLLAMAAAIAVAATAGRYHYAVDCAAGVVVAVLAWSVF